MRGQNKVSGVTVSFPSADHPLVPSQSVSHTQLLEAWDAESTGGPGLPFSSVTQLSLALCDPMDCSTPGFPVHHQLPELSQTHVRQVGCHPIISSSVIPFSSRLQSFPASGSFPVSQFFTSGGQIFRTDFL